MFEPGHPDDPAVPLQTKHNESSHQGLPALFLICSLPGNDPGRLPTLSFALKKADGGGVRTNQQPVANVQAEGQA